MYIQNKKVSDVMINTEKFPIVQEDTILKEVLEKMDNFHLGIACIINDSSQLVGIITDGDIRRKLLSFQKPLNAFFIDDVINQSIIKPTTVTSDTSLIDAIGVMEEKQVWDLPVIKNNGQLVGLLHLHSAIKTFLD